MPIYQLPCPHCNDSIIIDTDDQELVHCMGCHTSFEWHWSGRGSIALESPESDPSFIYRGVGRFRVEEVEEMEEELERDGTGFYGAFSVIGDVETMKNFLLLLFSQGGSDNFLIISSPNGGYVQFLTQRESQRLYGEALGDGVADISISQDDQQRLLRLGWTEPTDLNFHRSWTIGDSETCTAVADLALDTLAKVYRWDGNAALVITLNLSEL